MNEASPQLRTGQLLVAKPLLGDLNFDRTVILLTEHGPTGSVGLVLNRKGDYQFDQLSADFPFIDSPLYFGGPVEQDNLFFLHTKPDLIPESIAVKDNIAWGGSLDSLKEMHQMNLIGPQDVRFFLGYSGWSAGQLESEIQNDSWLIVDAAQIDIFNMPPEKMWTALIKGQGGKYRLWAHAPADPGLN